MPESVDVFMGAGIAGERDGWVGVWGNEESAGDVDAWLLRAEVVEKREVERRRPAYERS